MSAASGGFPADCLLDLGFGAQVSKRPVDGLLAQLLLDLGLYFLERRKLAGPLVVDPYDVPPELRLHRCIGQLAFLQLGDGLPERRDVARRREEQVPVYGCDPGGAQAADAKLDPRDFRSEDAPRGVRSKG